MAKRGTCTSARTPRNQWHLVTPNQDRQVQRDVWDIVIWKSIKNYIRLHRVIYDCISMHTHTQGYIRIYTYMGNCQNYGPFLGPYYNTGPNTGPNLGDPKRDHNFDNPPYDGSPDFRKE